MSDVIVDHVTLSFGTDGVLDIGGGSRVTVQNCLMSHPLEYAGHPEITHAFMMLMSGVSQFSGLYNILAHVRERVPESVASPLNQWIGTTVYNHRWPAMVRTSPSDQDLDAVVTTMDMRRNTFKKGSPTWTAEGYDLRFRNITEYEAAQDLRAQVYLEGNVATLITGADQSAMARLVDGGTNPWPDDKSGLLEEWIATSPIGTVTVPLKTASESYDFVLANAGNYLPSKRSRDSLDASVVSDITNGTYINSMYSSVSAAGGYPTMASGTYPTTNSDGIPTAWRNLKGESRLWYALTSTGRMVIEDYADDVANGTYVP